MLKGEYMLCILRLDFNIDCLYCGPCLGLDELNLLNSFGGSYGFFDLLRLLILLMIYQFPDGRWVG